LLRCLLVCVCLLASLRLSGQTGNLVYGEQLQRPAEISIRNVLFKNTGRLSEQERRALAKRVRRDDGSPDDTAAMAEELVRERCQDKGYFKVKVTAFADAVVGTHDRQFDIVVKVLDYGKQYRLQEIDFRNAKAFPEEELVKLIPVQPGEVFRRARIAKGLETLQQHYLAAGYVNITSIASTEFDESNASVRLRIDVDEGKVFRWGELRIVGLESPKAQKLTDGWQDLRGKTYSPETLREFCDRFFPAARGIDPAKYTRKILSEKNGTVDISIEFVSPWWISSKESTAN
jgi:outer membrane protein assembly factor BamA